MDLTTNYTEQCMFFFLQFQCCGVDNYTDFIGAVNWNRTLPAGSAVIPPTCCKFKNPDAYYDNPSAAEFVEADCQTSPSDTNSNWHKVHITMNLIFYNKQAIRKKQIQNVYSLEQ